MIIKHGDLFTTDAKYIGHGVNCRGIMGAGIAVQFKEKFPDNYARYRLCCHAASGPLRPGEALPFTENGKVVVNLATQDQPGADARYEWVFTACYRAALAIFRYEDKRLAIPQIGCGIGGLEWYKVATILDCIETLVPDFQFEVWFYDGV